MQFFVYVLGSAPISEKSLIIVFQVYQLDTLVQRSNAVKMLRPNNSLKRLELLQYELGYRYQEIDIKRLSKDIYSNKYFL